MKLNTLCGHLVTLLKMEMSELTELQRALKEQAAHFDPNSELNKEARKKAEADGVAFDVSLLKGKAGPGGGLEVDAFRAAFFLLALMLNGPRKSSASTTWRTWHLSQEGSVLFGWGENWQPTFTACPMTGRNLFGDALMAVVADHKLAARVQKISVTSDQSAEIHFDKTSISRFTSEPDNRGLLYRVAVIDGLVLRYVAKLLMKGE